MRALLLNEGYSVVVVHGLFIAVAFLVEYRPYGSNSEVVAHVIFLDQGLNLCPLHWHANS